MKATWELKRAGIEDTTPKWVDVTEPIFPSEYWACGKCGYKTLDRSKYCPNCGADMREES